MSFHGLSNTFSIVAIDPETGECAAASASMFPAVGKVVPHVRAGVGAFCTQHWHNPDYMPKALDLIEKGMMPECVLSELLTGDKHAEKRQLLIIDMLGRAAFRNPPNPDLPNATWWGGMAGRNYACAGNTLAGMDVVVSMARAFETTKGTLADRVIAAMVAGDAAGGDHRGKLAAGIRVAKSGVPGHTLELDIDESANAVIDLAAAYAKQR